MKNSNSGPARKRTTHNLTEKMTPRTEKIIEKFQKEIAEGKISKHYGNIEDLLVDLKKSVNE